MRLQCSLTSLWRNTKTNWETNLMEKYKTNWETNLGEIAAAFANQISAQ